MNAVDAVCLLAARDPASLPGYEILPPGPDIRPEVMTACLRVTGLLAGCGDVDDLMLAWQEFEFQNLADEHDEAEFTQAIQDVIGEVSDTAKRELRESWATPSTN